MAITSAIMQMRRGLEADFDPEKMKPGEWAVSTDKQYVRMCFSVGVCVRMATYDAFEADMVKIQKILEECQTIEDAVKQIQSEIDAKEVVIEKYVQDAKTYSETASDEADRATLEADRAKAEADRASSVANIGIMTEETAGIGKPDGTTILADDYGTISVNVENNNIYKESIGNNIYLNDSTDNKILEFTLYGNAEQYREPTPDNPVEIAVSGSDGSVEVVSVGKNLFNIDDKKDGSFLVDAIVDKDGYVNATVDNSNGTGIRYVNFWTNPSNNLQTDKNYKLVCDNQSSGCDLYVVSTQANFRSQFTSAYINAIQGITKYTILSIGDFADCVTMLRTYAQVPAGSVAKIRFRVMVMDNSITDDTYQPYTETTSTIPTPNGLAGIPVSSNGNYTDENGQQWICDEIVKYADGSGKRIQRIGKDVFDGSEDEGWKNASTNVTDKVRKYSSGLSEVIKKPSSNYDIFNGISNTFKAVPASGTDSTYYCNIGVSFGIDGNLLVYSDSYNTSDVSLWTAYLAENPMTLYYELAEPIITDLSAEEIAEIEKLHTFYPITNISNDAECGIKVKYVTNKLLTTQTELNISPATKREALNNGNVIDLIGKIEKWLLDLKAVAFSGSYSDLTNKPTTLDTYEEIMANTVSGRIAGALGVQEGFETLTNSLNEKIRWNNSSASGLEMFFGSFNMTIKGGQTTSTANVANMILEATGWAQITLIIPICQSNIPVVCNVQSNIIYAYLISGNTTYENVPFYYLAIGK